MAKEQWDSSAMRLASDSISFEHKNKKVESYVLDLLFLMLVMDIPYFVREGK